MRKAFIQIILALLLVSFGISGAGASYTVTPVKQYELSRGYTYSDWYLKYRNELGDSHRGSLYGSQYQTHLALWLRVEGISSGSINRNPNKILTVPVSGDLAARASFYSILSDQGTLVPDQVTIGEKTYEKSVEKGAEKLYTVVQTQPASVSAPVVSADQAPADVIPPQNASVSLPVSIPQPISLPEAKSIPDALPEQGIFTEEFLIMFGTILFLVTIPLIFVIRRLSSAAKQLEEIKILLAKQVEQNEGKQKANSESEKILQSTLRSFVIEDKILLDAIISAKILAVHGGNTLYLPLMGDGTEVLLSGALVKNDNKNIFDRIKYLHKDILGRV
jgi:hypothetical protein